MGHSSGAHVCAMVVLELLQHQLTTAHQPNQPSTPPVLQFAEQHFNGNSNSDNDDKHSTNSSGSFLVLGSQSSNSAANSDGQSLSTSPVLMASKFEVLETQKSETEMSDASMLESELRALTAATEASLEVRDDSQGEESSETSETTELGSLFEIKFVYIKVIFINGYLYF